MKLFIKKPLFLFLSSQTICESAYSRKNNPNQEWQIIKEACYQETVHFIAACNSEEMGVKYLTWRQEITWEKVMT